MKENEVEIDKEYDVWDYQGTTQSVEDNYIYYEDLIINRVDTFKRRTIYESLSLIDEIPYKFEHIKDHLIALTNT